jgi:predicted ATP-grasp superfamily ATP-dependent carboligase
MTRRGLPAPEARKSADGLPRDGRWLVKPLASGGGRSIRVLDEKPLLFSEPVYYQRRVDGPDFSAIYTAGQGRAELMGVTRQLLGAPGSAFAYRGSIGPWPVSNQLEDNLGILGRVLAESFDLIGLFGVDFVLVGDVPWPVEVNPRYTASVEVLELALGRSLLVDHLRACQARPFGESDSETPAPVEATPRAVGKAILFAERSFVVPDISIDVNPQPDRFAVPVIADVPWPSQVWAGDPVMTVFATGDDVDECEAQLGRAEKQWRGRLGA